MIVGLEDLKNFTLDLKPGDRVFLRGELGAGKTTLVRKLIGNLLQAETEVVSPTYTYYQKYGENIYHFDLYRLEEFEDFIRIGGEEILDDDTSIVFVEWPEKIEDHFSCTHDISLFPSDDDSTREIVVKESQ